MLPSVLVEPVRQRIAQEYDVADPAHLRQPGMAVGVPREAPVAAEPLRPGGAHEEGRHDQVLQLVREAGREELSEYRPAASTISRRTPRACRSPLIRRMSTSRPPSMTVAIAPSRQRASATASLGQ